MFSPFYNKNKIKTENPQKFFFEYPQPSRGPFNIFLYDNSQKGNYKPNVLPFYTFSHLLRSETPILLCIHII